MLTHLYQFSVLRWGESFPTKLLIEQICLHHVIKTLLCFSIKNICSIYDYIYIYYYWTPVKKSTAMPRGGQGTKLNLDILQVDKLWNIHFFPSTLLPQFGWRRKCEEKVETWTLNVNFSSALGFIAFPLQRITHKMCQIKTSIFYLLFNSIPPFTGIMFAGWSHKFNGQCAAVYDKPLL